MRFVELDGKRYAMRDIHDAYREQKKARRQTQLTLFALVEDYRPQSQRCADGRFQEPTLFEQSGEGKLRG